MVEESINIRENRYKTNETNLVIMETKTKIISILQRVMDMQNDIRLTWFLREFHAHER